MTPDRWRQITEVFHGALEHQGDGREQYLTEHTAGDPDLRREVETLLATHSRSGSFLEEPAWGVAAELILDDQPSLIGQRLGTYRVLDEIGRGGMGVVYAAEDARLGRTVAIKALAPEWTGDPRRRERLTREARAAAALSHPAIATIFALEEVDGALYIVSELVRGRTLRDELKDGPLPPDRLLSTLCDVASALAAAHDHGIVHRDLKPENIIRRSDGQIKVLDFGLARVHAPSDGATDARLTEAGLVLGTPGYMAPEQLAGRDVDARADIFALGVLGWELATGEHPFGADPAALVTRMADMIAGRSATLSRPLPLPGLDRIVRRCMRARPEERYESSAALVEDLRALVKEGETHGAPAPSMSADAGLPVPGQSTDGGDALWWWRFHQGAIAALNSAMPFFAFAIRRWPPAPYGSWMFYAVLGLATLSVTLRINLVFASRVHPQSLGAHRARLFPAIAAADTLLALTLLATSASIAGAHDEVAAVLLVVPIVLLASLTLVEPATTRAAFGGGRGASS